MLDSLQSPPPLIPEFHLATAGNTTLLRRITPALICMLFGLIMAALPHFASYWQTGDSRFLADGDDVLYLLIARAPFLGEWSVRDPFSRPEAHVPVIFTWLQTWPFARLAALTRLPLVQAGLVWRLLGGPLLAFTIYLLFRQLFTSFRRPVLWATFATVFALADGGIVLGRYLVSNFVLLANAWRIHSFALLLGNESHTLYRFLYPILNLPVMIALVIIFARPKRGPLPALFAALLMGLLVWLYFFLWTAAALALALYAMAFFILARLRPLERRHHYREASFTTFVLVAGLSIGSPQIVDNAKAFKSPQLQQALHRMSRGTPIPPGDPDRTTALKNFWFYPAAALGLYACLKARQRGWWLCWTLSIAGFGLRNSAFLTGLEFENFHWIAVFAPFQEILLLAVICLFLDRTRRNSWILLAGGFLALTVASGLFWRWESPNATEAAETHRLLTEFDDMAIPLRALSSADVIAGPAAVRIASLYGNPGILFHNPHSCDYSAISNAEVDKRHALNAWLMGMTATEYSHIASLPTHANPFPLPGWSKAEVTARRMAVFDDILAGNKTAELLACFRPTHLLTPATSPALPSRGGPWHRLAATEKWILWGSR